MRLISVNVSLPGQIQNRGKTVTTGIFKELVKDRIMLRSLNLEGDGQADLVGHAGIYKAAYAYSIENYDYWSHERGQTDFPLGQFGENFTLEGMVEDEIQPRPEHPHVIRARYEPAVYL
ncbi:MAG TPA: MOSC domain-containing protein [Rubrobacter sp.]